MKSTFSIAALHKRLARHKPRLYTLLGRTPVLCQDLLAWAQWMSESADKRVVAKTEIGHAEVSTVFLGIDHRFFDSGPAVLFETLVFGGVHDGEMWRYSSWEEAESGHAAAVHHVETSAA
ncbi:MAG: hypothetical protein HRJ53_04645 [Acidobacteria bacterium Pan2503]|uniref:Uncharacterized protein n=1 Tax=Candidatus Acidiferrum panamense TaxID=2741543 RepID=A0A7V8NMU7_9BACT|nr:hypothetical protein [Candidatus Acidoferrum panamensis]